MKITADELYALIDACPGNPMSNGAGLMRSGRVVRCVSSFDIETLAKKINERMAVKS